MAEGSCCPTELTAAAEDYLKSVFALTRASSWATTSGVAAHVGVTQASASAMLTRMKVNGLVAQTGWGTVCLTEHGADHARAVVRRHRLLETYLHDVLGLTAGEVHVEADQLEHALSPRVEELIDQALGRPAFDPHGSPIPAKVTGVGDRRWMR